MKGTRIIALVGWLLVLGCEKPVPPTTNLPLGYPPSTPQTQLPPPGILRISPAALPRDLQAEFKAASGPGPLALKLEYAGPMNWLDVKTEFWSKGKSTDKGPAGQTILPPLWDVAAFGFEEGPDLEGKSRVTVRESIPVKSRTSGEKGRFGTTNVYGEPASLKGHRVLVYKPQLPLDVKDGTEAVIWGVFVDEPEGAPASLSPEGRAAKAEFAWLFRMGPKDEKK